MGWGDYVGRQPILENLRNYVAFGAPRQFERQPDLLDSLVYVAFLASRQPERQPDLLDSLVFVAFLASRQLERQPDLLDSPVFVAFGAPCFALSQFDTKIRIPYYRTPCSFRFVSLKKAALSLQAGNASFFETDLFT